MLSDVVGFLQAYADDAEQLLVQGWSWSRR